MKEKIVTFGEILLRWSKPNFKLLSQGTSFHGNFGGSEANVAVSLALLGNEVTYVSRVPDNRMGRACIGELRYYGVDTSHMVKGGERLGCYYFEEAAAVRNANVVYDRDNSSFFSIAPGMVSWSDIFKEVSVFACSGITCAISKTAADATFEAIKIAADRGLTIVCDINYRKNLWKYGANAHDTLHRLTQFSDIIFGDQNEWEVLSGIQHIPFKAPDSNYQLDLDAYKTLFEKMHRQFPRCRYMVMALRNQIASSHHTLTGLVYTQGKLYHTHICDILPIIDPMGVGDAFVAAFIHAVRKWNNDPQRCLNFSLAASAMKNSVSGDFNLFTEEEITASLTAP